MSMRLRKQPTGPKRADGTTAYAYMLTVPREMAESILGNGITDFVPSLTEDGILFTPVFSEKAVTTTPKWLKRK